MSIWQGIIITICSSYHQNTPKSMGSTQNVSWSESRATRKHWFWFCPRRRLEGLLHKLELPRIHLAQSPQCPVPCAFEFFDVGLDTNCDVYRNNEPTAGRGEKVQQKETPKQKHSGWNTESDLSTVFSDDQHPYQVRLIASLKNLFNVCLIAHIANGCQHSWAQHHSSTWSRWYLWWVDISKGL